MKKQLLPLLFVLIFQTIQATKTTNNDPIEIYRNKYSLFLSLDTKLTFTYNNISLSDNTKIELKKVAKILLSQKDLKVEIQVYTDTRNDPEFSLKITQKRADRIKEFLINNGVNQKNIFAKGYGDTVITNKCKPFVKCTDAEHAVNRRVEFKILNPEKLTNFKMVKK